MTPYSLRLTLAYLAAKEAGFDGFAAALLCELQAELANSKT